jgi:predicted dinucleotide-binding enzyme
LHRSFESRELAEIQHGDRGETQLKARTGVRQWMETTYPGMLDRDEQGNFRPGTVADYSNVASEMGQNMLAALVEYLAANHADAISPAELQASKDFLEANFAIQADVQNGVDLSMGNKKRQAFVVPVRLSTKNPEYSREIRPLVAAFHYVDDELVPFFMRDMPTFVADEYEDGGYLTVAAVTADMQSDLTSVSAREFLTVGRARVNAAVATGKALGARAVGYGATLPGLMNWGKATADKEARPTTGHGGTTALMCMLIDQVTEQILKERLGDRPLNIAILGLGTIGLATAGVIAKRYENSDIHIFDPVVERMAKLAASDRYTAHASAADAIDAADIVLSTASTTFELLDPTHPNYIPVKSLEDKAIIDDSEPHSFKPEQVLELGGIVLDVIGQSYTEDHVVRRITGFGYGHTMAEGRRDSFGCELEVATLNRLHKDLEAMGKSREDIEIELGKYALTGPVAAEHTERWIELFKHYGIGPAPLQVFGVEYGLAA